MSRVCTWQDAAEAARWYAEAAKSGYAPAQNNLGGCYERGAGVRQDMSSAVECYRRAGRQASRRRRAVSGCAERGTGVRNDAARALSLYEQAARAGHPYAMYRLGLCYDWGRSVQPQFARAAQLYAQAAQAGVPEAAYALGLCCRDGRGVSRDGGLAFSWFAAAAAGCAQGALEADCACWRAGRHPQAGGGDAILFAEAAASRPTRAEPRRGRTVCRQRRSAQRSCTAAHRIPPAAAPARADHGGDLPPAALSATETAAEALYRLAYCRLAGIDARNASGSDGTASAEELLTRAARPGSGKALPCAGRSVRGGQVGRQGAGRGGRLGGRVPPRPALPVHTDSRHGQSLRRGAAEAGAGLLPARGALRRRAGSGRMEPARLVLPPTGAAEGGSAEALIRMAECAYRGIGTVCKPSMAKALLEGVRRRFGNRYDSTVCLWLGDFFPFGYRNRSPRFRNAGYGCSPGRRPPSPCGGVVPAGCRRSGTAHAGGYPVCGRRRVRRQPAGGARGEAMYRLALLEVSAPEVTDGGAEDRPFAWLCRAVLAGHPRRAAGLCPDAGAGDRAGGGQPPGTGGGVAGTAREVRRHRKARRAAGARPPGSAPGNLPGRTQPYGCGRTMPPCHPCRSRSGTRTSPATCPARRTRRIRRTPAPLSRPAWMPRRCTIWVSACSADCTPADRAAAVLCYRQAAAYTPGRGEPVCRGALWAQYSLGWCLVRGVGCPGDPREGVAWLSRASGTTGRRHICWRNATSAASGWMCRIPAVPSPTTAGHSLATARRRSAWRQWKSACGAGNNTGERIHNGESESGKGCPGNRARGGDRLRQVGFPHHVVSVGVPGLDVTLYGRPDSTHMQRFLRERRNDLLTLPDSVQLSTDLASALEGREVIVISIGAQGLRGLMEELRPLALRDRIVVLCMKGVEADTGLRLSEIAGAALDPSCRIAVRVGPGHVQEFYAGIPNCMVIDSADGEVKRRLVNAFSGDLIRFYYGEDLLGSEIGAASKNVIGIAAGMLDGMKLTTLKGALMSRGTREIARRSARWAGMSCLLTGCATSATTRRPCSRPSATTGHSARHGSRTDRTTELAGLRHRARHVPAGRPVRRGSAHLPGGVPHPLRERRPDRGTADAVLPPRKNGILFLRFRQAACRAKGGRASVAARDRAADARAGRLTEKAGLTR